MPCRHMPLPVHFWRLEEEGKMKNGSWLRAWADALAFSLSGLPYEQLNSTNKTNTTYYKKLETCVLSYRAKQQLTFKSLNNFAIRFLLEIPLRGFPFQRKLHQTCIITKNNTTIICQRISTKSEIMNEIHLILKFQIQITLKSWTTNLHPRPVEQINTRNTSTTNKLCVCMYIYIYIYIYIHIHTYIRPFSQKPSPQAWTPPARRRPPWPSPSTSFTGRALGSR